MAKGGRTISEKYSSFNRKCSECIERFACSPSFVVVVPVVVVGGEPSSPVITSVVIAGGEDNVGVPDADGTVVVPGDVPTVVVTSSLSTTKYSENCDLCCLNFWWMWIRMFNLSVWKSINKRFWLSKLEGATWWVRAAYSLAFNTKEMWFFEQIKNGMGNWSRALSVNACKLFATFVHA